MSMLLAGVGAALGGLFSASSASKAADAQVEAAEKAAEVQKYMYDTTRKDYAPFLDMGYAGIPAYMQELGFYKQDPGMSIEYVPGAGGSGGGNAFYLSEKERLNRQAKLSADNASDQRLTGNQLRYLSGLASQNSGGGGYYKVGDQTFGSRKEAQKYLDGQEWQYGGFQEAPGYQYLLSEGEGAINRNAAAGGRRLGGQTLAELQRHAIGQADQGYQTHLNRLAGLVGQGQQAVGSVAQAGQNYASNAGNAYMAAGNARASGYEGQANAFNGFLDNAMGLYTMNRLGAFG